jgi:hypothetical protein
LVSFANECQWRWKLNYLEGHHHEEYSIHFDFGTAMHEALEAHYRREAPVSPDEARRLFEIKFVALFDKHFDKYNKRPGPNDLGEMTLSGRGILQAFNETPELQGLEVVHNEFKLFEAIARDDGSDIKFKGYIDLILKGKDKRGKPVLWVCDFKTCSWGWNRDTREDQWKHFQVFLYKHFVCKRFNIDPKSVRCAFILLKKRPSKGAHPIEFFPVSAGPVSVQRALDVLNSSITEMVEREREGSFPKDRRYCVNKYGQTCQFFHTPLCPDES